MIGTILMLNANNKFPASKIWERDQTHVSIFSREDRKNKLSEYQEEMINGLWEIYQSILQIRASCLHRLHRILFTFLKKTKRFFHIESRQVAFVLFWALKSYNRCFINVKNEVKNAKTKTMWELYIKKV